MNKICVEAVENGTKVDIEAESDSDLVALLGNALLDPRLRQGFIRALSILADEGSKKILNDAGMVLEDDDDEGTLVN